MDWQIMQKHWRYKTTLDWQLKIYKTIIVVFISFTSSAQKGLSYNDKKKGQLSISWGWNRDAYTKSTISFKGADYDFALHKLMAHDRPTKFSYHNYLKLSRLTIPQTNLRISYFIKDNLAISFGDDHMKYVMDNGQTVRMKGTITRNGVYKGIYDGDKTVTEDFLTFEHTDGLNYLNLDNGKGKMSDIDLLWDIQRKIEGNTICPLGDAAAWPVAAAIRHFRDEFEWHVENPEECLRRNYGLANYAKALAV